MLEAKVCLYGNRLGQRELTFASLFLLPAASTLL